MSTELQIMTHRAEMPDNVVEKNHPVHVPQSNACGRRDGSRVWLGNLPWVRAAILVCGGIALGLWIGTGLPGIGTAAYATGALQTAGPRVLSLEHYLLLNQPGPLWLRKVDLRDMDLQGIELRGVNLSAAILQRTNLHAALLVNANLDSADLEGANLRQAILSAARLTHASLREAQLDYAALNDADLRGADLSGAILVGANLEGADLTDAILDSVHFDDATVWPAGFAPPVTHADASATPVPDEEDLFESE